MFQGLPGSIDGFQKVSMASRKFQWLLESFKGFQDVSMAQAPWKFQWFLQLLIASRRYRSRFWFLYVPVAFGRFHWLEWLLVPVPMASGRFQWLSMGFIGIMDVSRTSGRF